MGLVSFCPLLEKNFYKENAISLPLHSVTKCIQPKTVERERETELTSSSFLPTLTREILNILLQLCAGLIPLKAHTECIIS